MLRDTIYGLRVFRRSPGFAAVAVLSLALGIGANVTVFALVNALFLHPLPVADPARLVLVHTTAERGPGYLPVSFPNYESYRDQAACWSSLAAFLPITVSLSGDGGEPAEANGAIVTGNYFATLGVRAALGRTFLPEESLPSGGPPIVVLADSLWRSRFGADPKILGRTIRINGQGLTVIGVAPAAFTGISTLESSQLWVPVSLHQQILPSALRPFFTLRRPLVFLLVGRLRGGVTVGQAQREMSALAERLAREYPDANRGKTAALVPLESATVSANEQGIYLRAGSLLMGVVALVLLIACANVASMLLARGALRQREMAVRLALGATRGRLLRQILTESLLLALAAGVLSLAIAASARKLFLVFETPFLPPTLAVPLDFRVWGFALLASLLATLVCGLAPALQASRSAPISALRGDYQATAAGLRRFGLRSFLVAAQVALSCLCLVGTALFLISLRNAQRIDPGFEREKLMVASFDLDEVGYGEGQGQELLSRIVQRAKALPGVRSAAVAGTLNLDPDAGRLLRTAVLEGRGMSPEESPVVQVNAVGTGYFETLGIPILSGRPFTDADRQGARGVVIINRKMAAQLWPGADPVGARIMFLPEKETVEVVGVARDAKYNSLGEETPFYVYRPLLQSYASSATLHVRTAGRPDPLVETLRSEVQKLSPSLPLVRPMTIARVISRQLAAPRMGASLLAFFGGVALVLTVVGLSGLVAYSVSQRYREIGIRMALGASSRAVVRLFLGQVLIVFACGLACGLAGAFAATRWLSGLLFGIDAGDPSALLYAALLLTTASFAAAYVPVRRAARLSPALLLRR
ncbi:MAG TPA: ABC transporter permease [Thermoanaerobaculia bacterium]|jgi:putative ABC transport system permease protein|nr:ABC transporter permease [Thermoanaerobaculia bacterium]